MGSDQTEQAPAHDLDDGPLGMPTEPGISGVLPFRDLDDHAQLGGHGQLVKAIDHAATMAPQSAHRMPSTACFSNE